jgi:hypothetical protein
MDASNDDMRCPAVDSGTRTDTTNERGSSTVRIKMRYITPLLGAAAAAVAISAAPIAAASPGATPNQQTCAGSGSGTVCQSPGNVQINDAPPAVGFYPYGGDAFLLGGGGIYGGGGFHGGGGGPNHR